MADKQTNEKNEGGHKSEESKGTVNIGSMIASMKDLDLSGSDGVAGRESDDLERLLSKLSLEGVAEYMKSARCKNIITMAGAGISTSAGIPDFRSPSTGLYSNLQKYKLPSPEAIFEIGFFRNNPEPFYELAKELWPGMFKPTPCHYFIRLLSEKGLLLRHYTQNIDTLERVAGMPGEKIVEAHGTFHSAHCVNPACHQEYSQDWVKEKVFAGEIPHCEKSDCKQLVKPDIVFFGESLPSRFFDCAFKDFTKCDLLIILGTSLVVQPFASLTSRVNNTVPRLYINMEKSSSSSNPLMAMLGMGNDFKFDEDDNYRDVFYQSTCDDGCSQLADFLGWKDELDKLRESEHDKIENKHEAEKGAANKEKKVTSSTPSTSDADAPPHPTSEEDSQKTTSLHKESPLPQKPPSDSNL